MNFRIISYIVGWVCKAANKKIVFQIQFGKWNSHNRRIITNDKFKRFRLIVKVNRLPYKDVIDELDIGSVIYPKYITSDSILRYVRAMQNTIGSNVETLYHVLDK